MLISPFSHYLFRASSLTGVGHIKHPLKADLGDIEDDYIVCIYVRRPDTAREKFQIER